MRHRGRGKEAGRLRGREAVKIVAVLQRGIKPVATKRQTDEEAERQSCRKAETEMRRHDVNYGTIFFWLFFRGIRADEFSDSLCRL